MDLVVVGAGLAGLVAAQSGLMISAYLLSR